MKNKQQRHVQNPMLWMSRIGHYKRSCHKLKKDNNNKRNREEAHMIQEMKEEEKNQNKEGPLDLYYD